jgi:ADP-dependent NAD(P)H-hydrate dehydratase
VSPTSAEVVTPDALRAWPLPAAGESKHGRGDVLVVGGARSTPGAAMVAGLAALRVGAGVLGLAVAEPVAASVAAALWEAAVTGLPENHAGVIAGGAAKVLVDRVPDVDALLIGPGLDDADGTRELLEGLLPATRPDQPVLLDAYALGVLGQVSALEGCRAQLVLTPNRDEAARLLDLPVEELEGAAAVAEAIADRYGATVSYQRSVHGDGHSWVVPNGHSGLGTSGSGDVLAGAVAGLLARGASPTQAACWGTYLHAAAGDRLAVEVGRLGFLAREVLDVLPRVLTELEV